MIVCEYFSFDVRSGKEYKVHISYLKLIYDVGYDLSLASSETYPLFFNESNL